MIEIGLAMYLLCRINLGGDLSDKGKIVGPERSPLENHWTLGPRDLGSWRTGEIKRKWKDGQKTFFFFFNKLLVLHLCPSTNKLVFFPLCFHSLLIQRVRALALSTVL